MKICVIGDSGWGTANARMLSGKRIEDISDLPLDLVC